MTRIASKLGIAAALTLGMLSTAAAQVGRTTTSTAKVPVGKEMPPAAGEVVKVDTVTRYITDTLRMPGRTDTLRLTGPTVTVTRWDTVTVTETPGWMGSGSGLYFGLGAGAVYPAGGMSGGQTAGYGFQANLGIDPKGSPLGGRFTASVSRPYEERPTTQAARPTLMNLTADLKLKLLNFGASTAFPRIGLYAVGGGAYVRYQALREDNADGTWVVENGWHDHFGFDAGGGATMSLGHKRELFVELKVIEFSLAGHQNPVQVPLMIGFNWY